jgi:hypothetical protein
MNRTYTISFRTSDELRNALDKISKEERRSISSVIETALYMYLKDRKELKEVHEDKRRYPRKSVSLPALISKSDSDDKALQAGIVLDISLGGLQISIPNEYKYEIREEKQSEKISIVFTLPESRKPISVQCVAHHIYNSNGDNSIGASFADTDFVSYKTIQNYLLS